MEERESAAPGSGAAETVESIGLDGIDVELQDYTGAVADLEKPVSAGPGWDRQSSDLVQEKLFLNK